MSKIQSVIFPKDLFTKKDAIQWLKKHGLKHNKIDTSYRHNFLSFRQISPKKIYKYITKTLPNRIEFIIAI